MHDQNEILQQLRKRMDDAEGRYSVETFGNYLRDRTRYREHTPKDELDDAVSDSSGIFLGPILKTVTNAYEYKGNKHFVLFSFMQVLQDNGYRYPFTEFYFDRCYMDLFCMNQATDIIEIELKISRSDYARDFIKVFENSTRKGNKHVLLAKGKTFANHFYFLMPAGLVHPSEIPEHCGLITFREYNHGVPAVSFEVKKFAPLLHRDPAPVELYQVIADRLFSRLRSLDRKASGLFYQHFREIQHKPLSI